MKKRVKYVYVILVYRNMQDLEECLISIKSKASSFQAIVVNAFFDETSMLTAKQIADKYHCDFLNIENKGYSYGNNRGIEFANNNYAYDYIVVSNADILIDSFDDESLKGGCEVIAPRITAASGRLQNPMAVNYSPLTEYLEYLGFKNNCMIFLYTGILLSKVSRIVHVFIAKCFNKKIYKIFAAHGSHVYISSKAIQKLWPVYDEKIFLFAEEGVLAQKCKKLHIPIYYNDNIKILHKEDGSMKLSNLTINDEMKKANLYYYENYVKK